MAYCVKCGTQLSDGDKFCPKCGNPCDNVSRKSVEVQVIEQKKPSKTSSRTLVAVIVVIAIIGGAWFLWSRLSSPKYSLESLAKIVADYDYVENFHDGIAIGHKGDKHGYFNMQGEVITPCIYEEASSFVEGLASVKKGGKWGFINNTGEEIIPCQYNHALNFSEGLALVEKDDRCGFIDNEGKTVIPFIYGGNSYSFSEGLAAVSTDHGYQYIDKTGKIVLNCSWDNGAYWNFHNGLAPRMDDEGENYGFIDKTGKMVIPAVYFNYKYSMGEFKDGIAIVIKAGNNVRSEVIDVNGRNVLEFDFDGYAEYNDEVILIHSDDEVTFYNTKGEKIIEKKYKDAKPFSEGLAPVKDGEYWGYIDKTGKMVIPATFESADEFSEGLACVQKDGKYGYVDKKGNSTFNVNNKGSQQDGNDKGDDQESVDKSQQEEKEFLENFYDKMNNLSWEDLEVYVRKNITKNALQDLIDGYDYDCPEENCLALWMFTNEGDCNKLIERKIEQESENTFLVTNTWGYEENSSFKTVYKVRLGIVKEGGSYKIDTIINVSEEEQEKAYREINQYSKYVGKWRLRRTTDEGRKMLIEITLKENHSGEIAGFNERGNVADVLIYEQYPQCILEDGVIYMTKNGDINGKGVPKLRVASDGLYSYDGEKYIRQSE